MSVVGRIWRFLNEPLGRKGLSVVKLDPDFVAAGDSLDGSLPNTRFAYLSKTRGGLDSNVIMSPIHWIMRNFTSADLVMQRRTRGLWYPVEDHEVVQLVDEPNPFYDSDLLWKATLISYTLDGNAYWLKVRNVYGRVIQLWYLPHFLVTPVSEMGGSFIDYYRYDPWRGLEQRIAPRDIVHFRFGLDPRDVRFGLSPVKPILREVFTDDEAANFSASILRNMGVPGGVIAPKDGSVLPSSDDIKEMKEYMKTGFTGDRRGEWLVLGTPTETSQFGFDPNQLMLANLRDIAEERVCAALGIPAAVVGFGAGLQQTKVGATMKELRRLAWNSCLEPMQRSMAKQLTRSLVPEFVAQSRRFRLGFDTSHVPAFQEEETAKTDRIVSMVSGGVLTVAKAQEMLGLEVDDSQDIYLRQGMIVPVKAGAEPPPQPSQNGNGAVPPSADAVPSGTAALSRFDRRN